MERMQAEQPARPLIRISSTFFWHLSSDYDLAPIPQLAEAAASKNALDDDQATYAPMKVGTQIQMQVYLIRFWDIN
jgi:isopenicillin N synthase-like dioxygenase